MEKEMQVRNSTVDFLVFTRDASDDGINVLIENDTVWLTQEGIASLFDKARTTISEHISKIYSTGELDSDSTCRKFRHMGANGQVFSQLLLKTFSRRYKTRCTTPHTDILPPKSS